MDPLSIHRSPLYHSNLQYKRDCDILLVLINEQESLRRSIQLVTRVINKITAEMVLKSEADVSVAHTGNIRDSNVVEHVTLMDVGGEAQDSVNVTTMHDVISNSDDLQMKDYLSRPVQIAAISLALDADIDLSFNVWSLFLEDPVVRAKLRNYAFLRGNMNVRVTLSGTPFHYGRLLVAYEPFPTVNESLSIGPTYRYERLKYLSQAPGAKTLDVRENIPFELCMPYVSPLPLGRLYNNSTAALASTTPFSDFDGLGTLYISSLNQIKGVTATVSNVYLYIYAYMSEVTVSGATGSVGVIVSEADERKVGPIERYTSALIPVANAAAGVPNIGPFAMASSIVLTGLNRLSALFGWSYPVMVEKPVRQRPDPYQNGANTIGMDTGKRITLDPKQELTVDPRIVGVEHDELVVGDIANRESLLYTFNWNPGQVPLVDLLFEAAVAPRSNHVVALSTTFAVQPTALSFSATPFKYWRGSITYRFEIVSSNFHRGKLLFGYEPNVKQFGLISTSLNTNKQYTRVVDIQETQSFEFVVDWNFPRPYCTNFSDLAMTTSVGDQFDYTQFYDLCNGVIWVTPFTEVQSPDGSGIQVNVFVRSEDIQYNRLTDEFISDVRMPFVSGEFKSESDDHVFNREVSSMRMNQDVVSKDNIDALYFGESIHTFRSLLKRFAPSYSLYVSGTGGAAENVCRAVLEAWPSANSSGNTVWTGKTLFQYLRFSYLAMRGSLRRRLMIKVLNDNNWSGFVVVSLAPDAVTTASPAISVINAVTANYHMEGSVCFHTDVNAGVEIEVPNYQSNLFNWACNSDPWFSIGPFLSTGLRNYYVDVDFTDGGNGSAYVVGEQFATGEDFQLMRWLGAYAYSLNAGSPS